ncbi:tyrosine-type recombinase/integrase [Chitinophaga ginsengisegetis]|uniref:tyrosine-type recombinase/integrase n=1 Tax=Chitinophaga ginsengisegetis TaxID=393003 RepID=UPI000DBF7D93|nr:site-specific integrase [Chitinophaga ginsengisegetis]MDR6571374.1 integrase [Chitinophaga ginsengisegetis]MDR6651108.1 integrase [Chitinophaga ginsengisegetis]MDR6657458.1 integrase [Chitinophaga ginsengisegetis]
MTLKEIPTLNFKLFEHEFIRSNPHFKQRKPKEESFEFTINGLDLTPYKDRFKILKEQHPGADYISATFHSYVVRLLEEGRIGSALNYQDAYYSLKRFSGNVRFEDITVSYLNQYERLMIDTNGCSKTTVGIKLRSLRAIFNEAIENGIIRKEKCYPFGRRKYQIPASRNIKKALELSDVQKIYEYIPDNETDKKARDYWLFCYLCNGMNPKDMAYLKFKNIDGNYINFIRAKTERSTRNDPRLITAYINDDIQRIIKDWGNKDIQPNNYLFPILESHEDLLRQHMRVKALAKFINDGMRNVMKDLGINKKAGNMECYNGPQCQDR